MIIVKMMGNIGNQLFIYAFARHLQLVYDEEIIFDLSSLKRYYYTADYKLDGFRLPEGISYDMKRIGWIHRLKFSVTSKLFHLEHFFWKKISKDSSVPAFVTRKWLKRGCIYYTNRSFEDFPRMNKKYKYVYGYFQSEQYFAPSSAAIRNDLTLKEPLSGHDCAILKEISESNSVGVSIRANKAPENPKVKDNVWLGFISKDYYYEGMNRIAKEVKNPKFFVFSDDPKEVKEHFSFPYPVTIVSPSSSVAGMVLLSSCKHFVITNSTFSWWGAYLSDNPEKKVIMPLPWDRSGSLRECIYFQNAVRIKCEFED